MIGLHRSPAFGFSQEFAEYRAYNEGDDPRFIDWNVFARTERMYIKRFLGDTNSHLMILLDTSASMGFGGPPVSKLRYGKFLAASLAFLAARQHDAVGCMIFDEEVRDYRPPSSRAGKLQGVLHCIDGAEATTGTKFDKPFQKFSEQISRSYLISIAIRKLCLPVSVHSRGRVRMSCSSRFSTSRSSIRSSIAMYCSKISKPARRSKLRHNSCAKPIHNASVTTSMHYRKQQ